MDGFQSCAVEIRGKVGTTIELVMHSDKMLHFG
jgi:hypothetical protein